MPPPFPPGRVRAARVIAIAADALQVVLLPAWFAPPAGAGINIAIDIVVGAILCLVLRPHWAFAPAFVAEAFPIVGAIPFWWASVEFVTRGTTPPSAGPGGPTTIGPAAPPSGLPTPGAGGADAAPPPRPGPPP